jgi:steroid delta-isomerase-like uncharacterized protein
MSTEENKVLMRRAYDVLNQKHLAFLDEVKAPDLVVHSASTTVQGLEAFKQLLSPFFTAFPDDRFTVEDLIAEGDTVVVRNSFRGTHTGNFMGIPPTGKQVTWTGITITRFANGKAVELWSNADALGVMQQLGVIPAMGSALSSWV